MEPELKDKILHATIKVYSKKGMKFTMDDIARELSMSKKTIYTVFRNKNTLFYEMVDYCFDRIKISEQKVMEDDSLDTDEKLHRILAVLPDGYKDIDFRQMFVLREKYPDIYRKVQERLENSWENTLFLVRKGMEEGIFREFNLQLFKMMTEAAIEQFFQNDILVQNDINYQEALDEVVDILIDGIVKR